MLFGIWNRFTYIDVPILAKAKVGNDIIKVYGAIGPQFSFISERKGMKANANLLLPITLFDRDLNLDNLGFKDLKFPESSFRA